MYLALRKFIVSFVALLILLNFVNLVEAETYKDVSKKAQKLQREGKFLSTIDLLLKMRNLDSMSLDKYAELSLWAAGLLQEIGECTRSLDEINKLWELDLGKIDNDFAEIYHYTNIYQLIALCTGSNNKNLKYVIDNWKFRMPYSMYARSLSIYGSSLEYLEELKDADASVADAAYYYMRGLGDVLAYQGPQFPIYPILNSSQFLEVNYQYDLYDAIVVPILEAYDKGKLNKLNSTVFSFIVNNWKQQLWRGDTEYALRFEKVVDNQIKKFDAIPYLGMHRYIETKLYLSFIKKQNPQIVWDTFKSDNRFPEHLLNQSKDILSFFSILYKNSVGKVFSEGKIVDLTGIGAQLRSEDGHTVVSSIVHGGGAEQNGILKAEDRIIAVAQGNNVFEHTFNMSLNDVVSLIRGESGTKVQLKVLRTTNSDNETLELNIFRKNINIRITDTEIKDLIQFAENNKRGRFYKTISYALISQVYLNKKKYVKSIEYLKKYIKQLTFSVNREILRSFALRHDLNLLQKTSVEYFLQVFSHLSSINNVVSNKDKYTLMQQMIEVLNNTYMPSNILHASNNPNIYERIHHSSKLLYKVLRSEIKSKMKTIKIGGGPAPKNAYDTSWSLDYENLLYLIYLNNLFTAKNSKYIKKPLTYNIDKYISNLSTMDEKLFSVSEYGGFTLQTCYSDGKYYTEIKHSIRGLFDDVRTLRNIVDPTANKSKYFNYELANNLYNNLFSLLGKCAPDSKDIYIYLDPYLYNLPINALLTKPSTSLNTNDWFALKYDYTVLPNLGLLENNFPNRKLNSYLGIGNIDYQGEPSDNYTFIDINDLVVTRSGSGFSKINNLSPLPSTKNEIVESSKLFDIKSVLLGKDSTEENFRRSDFNDYDILHFATHGLITGEIDDIKQPGLVLTYPEKLENSMNDGYLSSSDISELKFDGQLVILSACNTAVDDGASNFVGMSELSNSFLVSGAKNIVVSQWPIVSETSADFMHEYLKNIKLTNNKLSLATTIRKFKDDPKFAHPKYWAPFIPIGKHWNSSEKKTQSFQTISTTNFGDENFVDEFRSSIKIGDSVFATVTSGSLSKDKSILEPYLLKYDLNGKYVSKHFLGKLFGPEILGQHNKKIYLGGYNFRKNKTTLIGSTSLLGSFDVGNNTFEGIIDEINFVKSNHNQILGASIVGDNLYLIIGSSNRWEKLDFAASFHLIKYNLENKSKRVYNFPVNKTNRIPMAAYASNKSLIFSENEKINIFINVERKTEKNKPFNNRFSEHYILVNDELVLQKEYKNRFFSKYISKEKTLIGYTFAEIGDAIKEFPQNTYKASESADIAFFTFKENEIKLRDVLDIPNAQNFKDIIKMGDKYLIIGATSTQLSWEFNSNREKKELDKTDYVNEMKLDFQKSKTSDPFLLLLDSSFQYIDSVVSPDRIFATISSIIKIDEGHYMLFREYKGSKSLVTVNKL